MNTLSGEISGGRVVLGRPPDWPDGTMVVVTPAEADGPMDAAEIARVLEAMAQSVPLERTDEERAAWDAERAAAKAFELGQFAARAEKLRRMWDDPLPLG